MNIYDTITGIQLQFKGTTKIIYILRKENSSYLISRNTAA